MSSATFIYHFCSDAQPVCCVAVKQLSVSLRCFADKDVSLIIVPCTSPFRRIDSEFTFLL